MKCKILFFLVLCPLNIVVSQQQPSYCINEDNSVSFIYTGKGRRVSVCGDFHYRGKDSVRYNDFSRKVKMKKQDDGSFRITTKPLVPETYTYSYRVNGKHVPDTYNSDTVWQMTRIWNIISITGTPQADLYLPSMRQGKIHCLEWWSEKEQVRRQVRVYTPAAYEDTADSLPVLYLLHGINGYEGSLTERGRIIQIVENLIDNGVIQPLIVVMPDCNIGSSKGSSCHRTLWYNVTHYLQLCNDHTIRNAFDELMTQIDTTFRVTNKRAIAGISSGARISADVAKRYPNQFDAVGLFSPVVYKKQLPTISTARYYMYTGKNDLFVHNARRFEKYLKKQNVEYSYIETEGAHHWRNWRLYISDFIIKFMNE